MKSINSSFFKSVIEVLKAENDIYCISEENKEMLSLWKKDNDSSKSKSISILKNNFPIKIVKLNEYQLVVILNKSFISIIDIK